MYVILYISGMVLCFSKYRCNSAFKKLNKCLDIPKFLKDFQNIAAQHFKYIIQRKSNFLNLLAITGSFALTAVLRPLLDIGLPLNFSLFSTVGRLVPVLSYYCFNIIKPAFQWLPTICLYTLRLHWMIILLHPSHLSHGPHVPSNFTSISWCYWLHHLRSFFLLYHRSECDPSERLTTSLVP